MSSPTAPEPKRQLTPAERRVKVRKAVETLVEMHQAHTRMRRTVLTLLSHKDSTDEQILDVAHRYRAVSQDGHARRELLHRVVRDEFRIGHDTYLARERLERALEECRFLT